jgi:hypothetical protein
MDPAAVVSGRAMGERTNQIIDSELQPCRRQTLLQANGEGRLPGAGTTVQHDDVDVHLRDGTAFHGKESLLPPVVPRKTHYASRGEEIETT